MKGFALLSVMFSAAIMSFCGLAAEEKPVLRIGAISDDHLDPAREETHRRTRACFELFRKMNVDVVVDTGDIADRSLTSEHRAFRAMFDEIFAGTGCVPFFCIANHDYNYVPNTKPNDPANIESAWKALGMESANPSATVRGYRFVNVFQNEPDKDALDKKVAQAVAENTEGLPIFVVNHVPPMQTTAWTGHWSSRAVRDVLNKYPQVVALTGHNHASVRWSANIWQGEFTAVNLGAHAEYSNKIAGEAVVLDVFHDRIEVRRYEAVSGRQIGADDLWTIPLPLDPMHGPYRPEVRAKSCPVPELPTSATLTYVQSDGDVAGRLEFTAAQPRRAAYAYRMKFESKDGDGSWKELRTLDWRVEQVMDAPETCTCQFPQAMLDAGRRHRVMISPLNSLLVPGSGRTFEFDVPPGGLTELADPCVRIARRQYGSGRSGKEFAPDADGWFQSRGTTLIVLPVEFTAAIKDRKDATIVFDITSEQPKNPCTLSLGRFQRGKSAADMGLSPRIYTLPGDQVSQRYAWTIQPAGKSALDSEDELCLVIREGDAFRCRINSVKCYTR